MGFKLPGFSAGINVLGSIAGGRAEKKGYNAGLDLYRQLMMPYAQAGLGWLEDLNKLRADPMSVTSLPGYQFRFGQGRETLENSAAARSDLLSGNTGRALTEYGQNFAMDEYGNELARLLGLTQLGLNAASGTAGGMAGLEVGKGNARANMFRGVTDAISGGLGTVYGQNRWDDLMKLYGIG